MKDADLRKIIDDSQASSYLVFADFNVMLWKVIEFYNKYKFLFKKQQNLDALLKVGIAFIFNRGPIGLSQSQYKRARVIAIADRKKKEYGGYWRHIEIAKDQRIQKAWDGYKKGKQKLRAYKDGRGDKNDFFYKAFEMAKIYCEANLAYFEFEGFEADDIAGAIHRDLQTDSSRIKIFYTVDRDWCQLCAEEKGYYWYTPRVSRPNEWMIEQAMNNFDVSYYAERKLDYKGLDHPSKLAEAKVLAGDLGDNLPPGSPKEYMCLISEHPDYSIPVLFKDEFQTLISSINVDEPNIKMAHLNESIRVMEKMGVEFDFSG